MAYTIETYEGGRVTWITYDASFRLGEHLTKCTDELTRHLDANPQPVMVISDAREVQIGFGDMVGALAQIAGGSGAFAHHPNLMELIVITHSDLIKMATNAMKQGQYGRVATVVFDDPDAAYDYALERLNTVTA